MRRAPRTVTEYVEVELAREGALREAVDEQLAQLRLEQDLVALRERRRLSQAELAHLLGVSQPVIARIESGRSRNLGIHTVVRIAAALGATVRVAFEVDPRPAAAGRRAVGDRGLGIAPRPKGKKKAR